MITQWQLTGVGRQGIDDVSSREIFSWSATPIMYLPSLFAPTNKGTRSARPPSLRSREGGRARKTRTTSATTLSRWHGAGAMLLCLTALLALYGCATVKKEKKANALEVALTTYGEAIRWGYFDTAYSHLHPDKRTAVPKGLDNIRVTGYEVVQAPLPKGEQDIEQVARIEYIHKDRQRLRTLSDRQHWRYEEKTNNWWLYSAVPAFD